MIEDTVEIPELTALNESAIYYVYAWLKEEFYDSENGESVYGQPIIDVLSECGAFEENEDNEDYWPAMGCLDSSKWEEAIEYIADQILWDRDFEMEDIVGVNPTVMEALRINMGYFEPDMRGAPATPYAMRELCEFVSKH